MVKTYYGRVSETFVSIIEKLSWRKLEIIQPFSSQFRSIQNSSEQKVEKNRVVAVKRKGNGMYV